MSSTVDQRPKKIGRRTVAKGAAWSAPVVALTAKAPASVVSDPCIEPPNQYYIELWSPSQSSVLVNRPSGALPASAGNNPTNCGVLDPGCGDPVGIKTTLLGVRLQQTGSNLIHHLTEVAEQGALTFTLAEDTCCVIDNVQAHVHRFGAASGSGGSGDCPEDYCQGPGTYFSVTGIGTTSVTASPNPTTNCPGGQPIHWGSPRQQVSGNNFGCSGTNQAQTGANANGQPYGYVRLSLTCEGTPPVGPD